MRNAARTTPAIAKHESRDVVVLTHRVTEANPIIQTLGSSRRLERPGLSAVREIALDGSVATVAINV
jgi:hypothetical protein